MVLIAFTLQLGLERTGDPFNLMEKLPYKFSVRSMELIESLIGERSWLVSGSTRIVKEEVEEINCDAEDQECKFKQKAAKIKADNNPKGLIVKGLPERCHCLSVRIDTNSAKALRVPANVIEIPDGW